MESVEAYQSIIYGGDDTLNLFPAYMYVWDGAMYVTAMQYERSRTRKVV